MKHRSPLAAAALAALSIVLSLAFPGGSAPLVAAPPGRGHPSNDLLTGLVEALRNPATIETIPRGFQFPPGQLSGSFGKPRVCSRSHLVSDSPGHRAVF